MGIVIGCLLVLIVPVFLPRRWAFLGFGFSGLFAALLWLDMHVQPKNDRGFGELLLAVWTIIGVAGFASVFLRGPVLRFLFQRGRDEAPPRWALWPLPLGILLSVFFMHWLSNRLAGASPAWLVHVLVAVTGVVAGSILWRFRPLERSLRDVWHVAVVGCAGITVWVIVSAVEAERWADKARKTAGEAPYCLVTFAGRDHPRPAREVLELSRLFSRSGGRSFIDDAHWLIVKQPEGLTAKRWRDRFDEPGFFEDRAIERVPSCTPVPGGNLG